MMFCAYGTTGTPANPWDDACAQWDRKEISTAELISTAKQLFEGEALDDVLADVIHADLSAQNFVEQAA